MKINRYITVPLRKVAKDSGVSVLEVTRAFGNMKRSGVLDFEIIAGNRVRYTLVNGGNVKHPTICQ